MIAVYVRRRSEWAESLRCTLLDAGIPCALVGPEYGNTTLALRLPFLTLSPEDGEMHDTMRQTLPPESILSWPADVPPVQAVWQAYHRRFGEEELRRGGVRFMRDTVRFRGEPLHLSACEMRIVLLLTLCTDICFTAEEIASLCLQSGSASAAVVHICHINTKTQQSVQFPMIESRRYKGYRIRSEY